MRIVTVCFLLAGEKVLLAQKNGGRGHGHWGGYGGELKSGETHKAAAIREIWEEARIIVQKRHLKKCAVIRVHKTHNDKEFEIHVFTTHVWRKVPRQTREMRNPTWFSRKNLPRERMWPTDKIWLPWVLEDKRFKASFLSSREAELLSHREVKTFG